ncbi:Uncharacterised protein [Peptoniphilus harei]|uniref:Uncharacterized protein n=1 Tax=Peptoniphilus harei TaxID=54005 RepID=A0A2X1WMG2_9FIRM|nr:hypothetical protein [Peptoniphilus harei]SPY32047.1 Uncharacterised protein [Peptoniphilus harei]
METFEFLVDDYSLDDLKFMEIINDPTYMTSIDAVEKALKAWDLLLQNGYKIYGIGGSDSHLYQMKNMKCRLSITSWRSKDLYFCEESFKK